MTDLHKKLKHIASPWDNYAHELACHLIANSQLDYVSLHTALVSAASTGYRKGYVDGAQSEHDNPHREDMGR